MDDGMRERLELISNQIIGAAIEVHRELGPGLLESAYEERLAFELAQRGLAFTRQARLPLIYKGRSVGGLSTRPMGRSMRHR
jgi:GxxExxY protein